MSTAANVPTASSAATVRAEKPQRGASGVPFMKRMTSFSAIASWIAALICCSGVLMAKDLRFGSGDQGQRMDRAADLGPEDRVHAAMLLDPAQPRELGGDDSGAEVIPAAVEIDDVRARARDGSSMRCFSSSVVGTIRSLARSVGLATLLEALDLPTETQE